MDYTGRFNAQYDESGKRVMTFTAAGANNQTIWGIKTEEWTGSEQTPVSRAQALTALYKNEIALPDQSGGVYISGTELLSNLPYFIVNRNSGLLLDADPETGKLCQWEQMTRREEAFRLTDLGNGYCRITPLSDESKCVTVQGSSAENGLDVSLAAFSGADNPVRITASSRNAPAMRQVLTSMNGAPQTAARSNSGNSGTAAARSGKSVRPMHLYRRTAMRCVLWKAANSSAVQRVLSRKRRTVRRGA